MYFNTLVPCETAAFDAKIVPINQTYNKKRSKMSADKTKTPSKNDALAAALRANLLKRKQQSRGRTAERQETSKEKK